MSSPNAKPPLSMAIVPPLFLVGWLALGAARADECRDLDGRPLAGEDCAEFESRLGLLAKIEDARARIEEARHRREGAKPPGPPAGTPPIQAPSAPTLTSIIPPEPDRTLEVFGDQARIRYQGAELLVRAGQRLARGGQVLRVASDGVEVGDGSQRRLLPLALGGGR